MCGEWEKKYNFNSTTLGLPYIIYKYILIFFRRRHCRRLHTEGRKRKLFVCVCEWATPQKTVRATTKKYRKKMKMKKNRAEGGSKKSIEFRALSLCRVFYGFISLCMCLFVNGKGRNLWRTFFSHWCLTRAGATSLTAEKNI